MRNESDERLRSERVDGRKTRTFRPRRTIKAQTIRLRGKLLRPGDKVRCLRPGFSGREGVFRGVNGDGRLSVNLWDPFLCTRLLLEPCEIELMPKPRCSGVQKRAVEDGAR
jgi:hypothetical protein